MHPSGHACSVRACPQPAIASEQGEVGHWLVTVYYCDEHARELAEGTPLGPVGIDSARVEIAPIGESEPRTGGLFPGIA